MDFSVHSPSPQAMCFLPCGFSESLCGLLFFLTPWCWENNQYSLHLTEVLSVIAVGKAECLGFFLLFFFCQKVQQQLNLTCCYRLWLHTFIFQNTVDDKIKRMSIFFVQTNWGNFKIKMYFVFVNQGFFKKNKNKKAHQYKGSTD